MQHAAAIIVFLLASYASCADGISLDEGWRYHIGEAHGAETADFDDAAWNTTDLPHDAATEFATDPEAPSGGAGGFHRSGVVWYRKTWRPNPAKLRPAPPDARLHLAFDGVTRHAEVWLNGEKLGSHAYDYTPFSFDVTDKLRWDAPNVIAVKVNSTAQPASRWYAGWGITRHVSLQFTGPIDFQPQSLWTHTRSLDADHAEVRVLGAIQSEVVDAIPLRVMAELTSPDGGSVEGRVDLGPVRAGVTPFEVTLEVPRPAAWSPESPSLYDLSIELEALAPSGPRSVATQTQRVGLRTVKVDPERGLLLNGAPIKLFGGNVHHDHGPLGAASFDDAEVRRVSLLKQAGFNAVRTSHNPPSTAFLDACDAQGLLVIDEFFDGWRKQKVAHDYGNELDALWPDAVEATVRRDRRHPSVVMWSLGNEVYERGEASGAQLATQLAAVTRSLDPTRPLTIGLNSPGERPWSDLDAVFTSVDVAGYNYESARFAGDRQRHARRVMMATETYPAEVFTGWRATQSAPWVVGEFVWSAIDYLGEAGIGRVDPPGVKPLNHWEGNHFPYRAAVCGDIDLVGHRKPISHFRNIVWDREEKLYAAVVAPTDGAWGLTKWATEPLEPSWSWQVEPGTELTVVVASRWPRVRLELNGRVVAEEAVNESTEFTARFKVPYEAGELAIIGLNELGGVAERQTLPTAGPPTKLRLTADRTKTTAGIGQLVFVDVELVDDPGDVHPRADREVRFEVVGPATLQAVGSADPTSTLPYAGDRFASHHGRLLAVLRSTGKPGRATLVARAAGLPDQRLEVEFLPH